MEVSDIRVFIPSKDFEVSVRFYTELGFTPDPATDDLMLFESGECTFFLQRYYQQQLAENLMLQLCVDDIAGVYDVASKLEDKQKITPITHERWGKVFYLWGPSGELLHITQLNDE